MLRRIPVIAACVAVLASSALPAAASTRIHGFSIPGVYGVRAWGTYADSGPKVQVTVCVEVTRRGVYGAAAVGLEFDSGYRHHNSISAVTIGDDRSRCHAMVTPYASHLVVEALSGYRNGKIRQQGRLKRIY